MNAVTLKSWRVVYLLGEANSRSRPLPFPLIVQAESAESAKTRADEHLERLKLTVRATHSTETETCEMLPVVGCFVTEARA